jgi:hypothetical protein
MKTYSSNKTEKASGVKKCKSSSKSGPCDLNFGEEDIDYIINVVRDAPHIWNAVDANYKKTVFAKKTFDKIASQLMAKHPGFKVTCKLDRD